MCRFRYAICSSHCSTPGRWQAKSAQVANCTQQGPYTYLATKHVRIERSHDRHECSILRRGETTLAVARVPTTVGTSSTNLATPNLQNVCYDLLLLYDKPCNAHTMHTPCYDDLCCNSPDLTHPEIGACLVFLSALRADPPPRSPSHP